MTDLKLALTQDSKVSDAFWLSFIPLFGGLAIVRESNRLKNQKFAQLGWGVFALSLVMALGESLIIAWLLQAGLAIWLRMQYALPAPEPLVSLDFNSRSKNDLVRVLGLPIVYANDIEMARTEGFIFTHAEELTEIIGIPEELVRKIESRLIFAYDEKKDGVDSWRRVNYLSASEIEAYGIDRGSAQKIVTERDANGDYRSAIDIKRRTGISLRRYHAIL